MLTTVAGVIVHECPHRDQTDRGTVEMTFKGEAPELYKLAALVRSFAKQKLTHEELTLTLAERTGAAVVTRWCTAGFIVEVRA